MTLAHPMWERKICSLCASVRSCAAKQLINAVKWVLVFAEFFSFTDMQVLILIIPLK